MALARRVLGLGLPRGGTRYASRLLVSAGVRALHEANGRDGSVSCWLVPNDWWHPHAQSNGIRSDFPEAHLIHVVRNPLDTISSLSVFNHHLFWQWQRWHSGIDYEKNSIRFYANFWLRWNDLIEKQNPFVRLSVERPAESWQKICETLEIDKPLPEIEIDSTWKTKEKPKVTWSDLGDLEASVREVAKRYGYEDV